MTETKPETRDRGSEHYEGSRQKKGQNKAFIFRSGFVHCHSLF